MLVKNISLRGTVIRIGDVDVHILDIANKEVRLGIEAPRHKRIEIDTFLRRDVGSGALPAPYRRGGDEE